MASETSDYKTSFPQVSTADTEILILGTLPGDRSLQLGEYFAHPRNRFWKIIAVISGSPVPETYPQKLDLLHTHRIGLWNVLHSATRMGSLDGAIRNEQPNDLPAFIARHEKLKVIGFDGLKPEAYYNRYFSRDADLSYLSLPSCSPANARYSLERLCSEWRILLSADKA